MVPGVSFAACMGWGWGAESGEVRERGVGLHFSRLIYSPTHSSHACGANRRGCRCMWLWWPACELLGSSPGAGVALGQE